MLNASKISERYSAKIPLSTRANPRLAALTSFIVTEIAFEVASLLQSRKCGVAQSADGKCGGYKLVFRLGARKTFQFSNISFDFVTAMSSQARRDSKSPLIGTQFNYGIPTIYEPLP